MVKGGFAAGILGLVFSGDNRYIHHAAAAKFPNQRRLLGAVPDTAVVYGEVAGLDIKANLAGIGVIVDEVFFAKKEPEHALFMRSRQYPEASVLERGVVKVDADVEHGHDLLAEEEIPRAVGMPAHLRKGTFGHPDIMIQN